MGSCICESSKSTDKKDAIKLRDKMLGKRAREELSVGEPEKILINELLDDVLKSDIEESTRYVWTKVVEKNVRPFFGKLRAARLATDKMDEYRTKRKGAGGRRDKDGILHPLSVTTVNRELSILRTAHHNGRKRTPPKVNIVPYFLMMKETNIRQLFLQMPCTDGCGTNRHTN